jgi:hypothetical protein
MLVGILLSLQILSLEGIITSSTAQKIKQNSLSLQNITAVLHKTGNATNQAKGVAQIFDNAHLLREILGNLTALQKQTK